MEPPLHMIEYLLGPAIPYIPHKSTPRAKRPLSPEQEWELSPHNPKNRIDSGGLNEQESGWRLFWADLFRRRLSVVPTFALGRPPRRIDVFLSANIDLESPAWRTLMPPFTTMVHMNEGCRDSFLVQHIVRALAYWSRDVEGFVERYMSMPFASKIIVKTLKLDAREMEIALDATSGVEMQLVSAESLRATWKIPSESWPTVIDIGELGLIAELHESVTLVSAPSIFPEERYVLKSSTSQSKYLYHELKQLLSMASHQNIMPKPLAIVTKKVQFGNKRGVCGILLPYFPASNLAQALRPGNAIGKGVDRDTKFRWAFQVASALLHLRDSPVRYYSDLKLDNIMLVNRNGRYDVVLIDFEQRGAWFSWSPPEINRIAHIVYLAESGGGWVPPVVQERFQSLCSDYLPSWQGRLQRRRPSYTNVEFGYNVCWQTLNAVEREKAMSFMFGRVLWCIFEGQASPNAVEFLGAEIFRETNSSHRFPETRQTPPEVRELIYRCTSTAPEWQGKVRCVERDGEVVCPAGKNKGKGEVTEEESVAVLREWWLGHEREAERYVKRRFMSGYNEDVEKVMWRPGMAEIVDLLRRFGGNHGFVESL